MSRGVRDDVEKLRARELQARIDRVEALADEWDERWGRYSHAAAALGPQKVGIEFATKAIRAALERKP